MKRKFIICSGTKLKRKSMETFFVYWKTRKALSINNLILANFYFCSSSCYFFHLSVFSFIQLPLNELIDRIQPCSNPFISWLKFWLHDRVGGCNFSKMAVKNVIKLASPNVNTGEKIHQIGDKLLRQPSGSMTKTKPLHLPFSLATLH